MSVSALSRELGVSHNLLHQRFGSKEGLWYAAVDWGFGGLADELAKAADPTLSDPLEQLAVILRRFLEVSAERPELVGLMNIEGRESSERLTFLYDHYVEPLTVADRARCSSISPPRAASGRSPRGRSCSSSPTAPPRRSRSRRSRASSIRRTRSTRPSRPRTSTASSTC